ncbi:cysteine hydrolase [Kitasatospora sp. NPDC090308]|uniref:cysteine hydrolase n=1 Tax=Kitasatospora sp. NPDC090308 TaxID=3364082 RepID=UPI00380E75B9
MPGRTGPAAGRQVGLGEVAHRQVQPDLGHRGVPPVRPGPVRLRPWPWASPLQQAAPRDVQGICDGGSGRSPENGGGGRPGATRFHPGLAPLEGGIVVRKVRIGTGATTDLYERLEARGVDTPVLSGISTGGVVLSTLLDAADRDHRPHVLSDGVAARDPEVHRVLLEKVFPSRTHVIDTARPAELRGRGGPLPPSAPAATRR